MNSICYMPSKDELIAKFHSSKKKRLIKFGKYKIWRDEEGNICEIEIDSFTEELAEFNKSLNVVRLGGIWKGIDITDKDIKEAREDLLKKLEEKW